MPEFRFRNVRTEDLCFAATVARGFAEGIDSSSYGVRKGVSYRYGGSPFYAYWTKGGTVVVIGQDKEDE